MLCDAGSTPKGHTVSAGPIRFNARGTDSSLGGRVECPDGHAVEPGAHTGQMDRPIPSDRLRRNIRTRRRSGVGI